MAFAIEGQLCDKDAGTCDGAGTCVEGTKECTENSDCGEEVPCVSNLCNDGICSTLMTANGLPCGEGLSCYQGECVECFKDQNCADGDGCTQDSCEAGVCVNTPKEEGAVCNGGQGTCSEEGECVEVAQECANSEECDDGNPCTEDACVDGVCAKTVLANGSNCGIKQFCVDGECSECISATQCNDNDGCTTDACDGGTCSNTPERSWRCLQQRKWNLSEQRRMFGKESLWRGMHSSL